MNVTDIPRIPNTNADKFTLVPGMGILKEIKDINAPEANGGRFDIFLKSGDTGVEASLADYSEKLFEEIFSSGSKGQSELQSHFANARKALSEAFSESRFSIAGYEKLCSILEEARNAESIVRMKSSLGQMDNQAIAEHIGTVGKKLDEAFSNGFLTKEQYASLNEKFREYAVNLASFCKTGEAKWAAFQAEYAERGFNPAKSFEDIQQDRQSRLENFLKNNPVDMELIMSMINAVRNK